MAKTKTAAPEPVRDHFIHGVPGLKTADEAAAWWAAHPPDPSPEEGDETTKAPETPGPSDSED